MRRLFSWSILLTYVLVISCGVIEPQTKKAEISDKFGLDVKFPGLPESDAHGIDKRGLGSVIAVGVLTTVTIGATGYQLGTALSGGCSVEPSICTDRDEIKRIEGILAKKAKQYTDIYYANQWKFLNLQKVMLNNKYILRYVNDTVRAVETIGDIISMTTTKLGVSLKTMEMMFAKSKGTINGTIGTLEDLVGPFEFELASIEKEIQHLKESVIIGLVVQRVGEILVSKLVTYVNSAVAKARGNNVNNDVIHRMSSNNVDLPANDLKFWQKAKNYFKSGASNIGFTFKAVGADIKRRFGNIPKNMKKWRAATSNWDSFKTKLRSRFAGDSSKMNKIRTFFKDPKGSVKYGIKNFRFSKGAAFMHAVGLVIDGIQIAIEGKHWADVAQKLREAKTKYKNYLAAVEAALNEVNNETATLNKYWSESISSFSGLVNQFSNVITKVRENNIFMDVFGLSKVPVDASHAFFKTNFNTGTTNQQDLKGKQDVVIDFFNKNGKSLTLLKDKFKAHSILIGETKDLTQKNYNIESIYVTMKRVYTNFASAIVKGYASKLVKQDVVCSTAMVLPNKNRYDYYPLDTFRTKKCHVTNFNAIEQNAVQERDKSILQILVKQNVPKKKTPSTILDLAKGAYTVTKSQRLKAYGVALKEKVVVCEISVQNPQMNNYMFYDLIPFRPDCSKVSDSKFTQIKADAQKLENAKGTVGYSMGMCVNNPVFCQCPSALAPMLKVSVKETNILIEDYRQQHKPKCNYVEKDGKCSWDCPK